MAISFCDARSEIHATSDDAVVQLITNRLAQESLDFGVEYIETRRAMRTAT